MELTAEEVAFDAEMRAQDERFLAEWRKPIAKHHGGVEWSEAPVPRRWHRCRTWSTYLLDRRYDRCACGAISEDRGRHWDERNSRR